MMSHIGARQANHKFSARAERGDEILITERNKPVAVLSPYRIGVSVWANMWDSPSG